MAIWSHYKFENIGDHCPRQCSKNQPFGEPECSTDGGDCHPRREQFHKDRNASSQRSLRKKWDPHDDSKTPRKVFFSFILSHCRTIWSATLEWPPEWPQISKNKTLKLNLLHQFSSLYFLFLDSTTVVVHDASFFLYCALVQAFSSFSLAPIPVWLFHFTNFLLVAGPHKQKLWTVLSEMTILEMLSVPDFSQIWNFCQIWQKLRKTKWIAVNVATVFVKKTQKTTQLH